jgi:hypothetical protein
MFVAPDARAKLQAEGRESFFAEVVDPVAERALALGVPLADVIARLRAIAATQDGGAA